MSLFLSTLSLRRATAPNRRPCPRSKFLSTLSLRRATANTDIIILDEYHFYPRSPCGERPRGQGAPVGITYFYPRSPCGERLIAKGWDRLCKTISIHALLAESDRRAHVAAVARCQFLSTLSLRRATAKVHKTVGHFCAYGTNFMGIASSC